VVRARVESARRSIEPAEWRRRCTRRSTVEVHLTHSVEVLKPLLSLLQS